MRSLIRPLAVLLIGLAGSMMPAAAKPVSPFQLRHADDVTQRDTDCPALPAPVLSLDLVSKYGTDGPERDDIDDAAEKAFDQAMQPVRDYEALVVRQANRFTDKGKSGDAACAIALLKGWAEAGALADPKNSTAIFKLATALSGLSAAWQQVTMQATPADRGTIDQWLSARATLVRINFNSRTSRGAKTGNHRAWAALGVAMTGVATGRDDLVDWGLTSYDAIICDANPDGSLPVELARGKKARDYHLFASAPLVMLAEIGIANGKDSYAPCNHALERIVRFTFAAVADPSAIETLAKAPQHPFPEDANLPPANRLAFMEPYLRRLPGTIAQEAAIHALRPLKSTDLGGDMTLLFGGR
jgi:poly(beta-D-mannuronate) lyase